MSEQRIHKRSRDALKAIEDAVFDLLAEKEFEHVTARDIYHKAKVNKMTFYKYHNNKYDALAKAFVARLNEEYDLAFPQIERIYDDFDMDEANYLGLMFMVDFTERYHTQFSHLVSSSGDLPRDVVFNALFDNYRPFLAHVIGRDLTEENEYLLYFVFGTYRSLYDCQMQQLAKSPKGTFPRKDAEKACRAIAKSFSQILRHLHDEGEA